MSKEKWRKSQAEEEKINHRFDDIVNEVNWRFRTGIGNNTRYETLNDAGNEN